MKILLRIAYDGTAYSGFQSQNNSIAIQDVLEDALSDLFGRRIKTIGASRTDAGVHAKGNVAVFDVETRIPPEKILLAVNPRLPEDIRVIESKRCGDDFHPLRAQSRKTYTYRILHRKTMDPLRRFYCHHVYYPLDTDAMSEAAGMLAGEHDFAGFCAAGFTGSSTVRTLYESRIEIRGDEIIYTVTGNGFLYNMVRIIAGTLIDIGKGRWDPGHIAEILETKDRRLAGDTAPARGLTLEKIEYLEDM